MHRGVYWTEIFSFLFVFSLIALAALIVWQIVPSGFVPIDEAKGQLLSVWGNSLAPEANEQVAYIAALALVLPLTWVGAGLFARVGSLPWVWLGVVWGILIVGAILLAFPADGFRRSLIAAAFSFPRRVQLPMVIAIGLLCLAPVWRSINTQQSKRVVALSAGLAVFATNYVTGVFGEAFLPSGSVHFDAFYFSIAQAYFGATCLAYVIPQYGCYGEFMAILLRPFGLTVFSSTFAMTSLNAVAVGSMVIFAAHLVRSPVALLGCVLVLLIVSNNALWAGVNPGPYFQYLPLRTLFPALSLMVVLWWLRSPSAAKAVALGSFSALAVCWNLDSGLVVSIALFGLTTV